MTQVAGRGDRGHRLYASQLDREPTEKGGQSLGLQHSNEARGCLSQKLVDACHEGKDILGVVWS